MEQPDGAERQRERWMPQTITQTAIRHLAPAIRHLMTDIRRVKRCIIITDPALHTMRTGPITVTIIVYSMVS